MKDSEKGLRVKFYISYIMNYCKYYLYEPK